VADQFQIGSDWNGGSFTKAVVDELRFSSPRTCPSLSPRRSWVLGAPPQAGAKGEGIGAEDTTMPIHVAHGYTVDTAALDVRESGGLLRVDDELIGFSEFDTSTQTFSGLERGAFGTEAKPHSFESPVSPVYGIGVSRLTDSIQDSSSNIPLANSNGFPIYGGFVRIGTEVLGYTRIGANSVLEMPQGRSIRKDGSLDPYADTDASVGLFRGRFGTEAAAHDSGSLVYHLDHRYPDYAREKADHPQMAWYTVSRESRGAIWKRVSWDQRVRALNGIRVMVRFEGGPAWDSDKVIHLNTDAMPETDRNKWIYQILDPRKENLLNVQSDRIECRVYFNYEKGAFTWDAAGISSDAWKETPWIKAFRIESIAPAAVITTEDLR
jgi:hypothetical protein